MLLCAQVNAACNSLPSCGGVQVIVPALLKEGFEAVEKDNLVVTDDVSIIEAIGKPVKITKGDYSNMKVHRTQYTPIQAALAHTLTPIISIMIQVTTPEDMSVAEKLLSDS
jgi:2-C-methyl-D-erythritol 4-phosphate cytidylyltransferase